MATQPAVLRSIRDERETAEWLQELRDRDVTQYVIVVLDLIAFMSDAQRDQLFIELRRRFCVHCGRQDPYCRCNDDS